MKNKPGMIITNYLKSKNIKPVVGCSCYELAERMDKTGPEEILSNIEYWTDAFQESAKEWRKSSKEGWLRFIPPPRYALKRLVVWACEESQNFVIAGT